MVAGRVGALVVGHRVWQHAPRPAGRQAVAVVQALFLRNICVVFRLVVPFGKLLFIHASTNATDDHKYSPLPSADFDSFWYHLAHSFSCKNVPFDIERALFERRG